MQRDKPCIRLFKLSIVPVATPAVLADECTLPDPTAVLKAVSVEVLFIAVTAATGRFDPTAAESGAEAG